MSMAIILPLSALTMWLFALYFEKKFEFKDPNNTQIVLKNDTPWWKRLIISHNAAIRLGGLFTFWFALNLLAIFGSREITIGSVLSAAIALIGLCAYILALLWNHIIPTKQKKRRRK